MPLPPTTRVDHLEGLLRQASTKPSIHRVIAAWKTRSAKVEDFIAENSPIGKTLKQVGVFITSAGDARVDVTKAFVTNLTGFLAPMGWVKAKDAYEDGPIEMSGTYYWTWKGPSDEVLTLEGIRSAQQAIPGSFSLKTPGKTAHGSDCSGCDHCEESMTNPLICSPTRLAQRYLVHRNASLRD